MKKWFMMVALVVVLIALAGCAGHDELAIAELAAKEAEQRAIQEQAKVDQIDAEYDGRSILEITKTLANISEADARALRDLATEDMRARESWRLMVQLGLLALVTVAMTACMFALPVALRRIAGTWITEDETIHVKVREQ